MSELPPQARRLSFTGTVSGTYPGTPQLDIRTIAANRFWAQGFTVLNQDASIIVYVSFDGTTDDIELDPADAPSLTLDNFHPCAADGSPLGQVWLRSASGTPRVQSHLWA